MTSPHLTTPAPRDQEEAPYDREAERVATYVGMTRGQQRVVPPPTEQAYRPAADYPSVVLQNTRVDQARTPAAEQQTADATRVQTQLQIAQRVALEQLRAQQQRDEEAAERLASAALGQYIAPPQQTPAMTRHR